jgi:hypothetical protein
MDQAPHVGNQVIGIKVEEITDVKGENDPGKVKSPVIKTELEVSCIMDLLQIIRIACFSMCFGCSHETVGLWSRNFEDPF